MGKSALIGQKASRYDNKPEVLKSPSRITYTETYICMREATYDYYYRTQRYPVPRDLPKRIILDGNDG